MTTDNRTIFEEEKQKYRGTLVLGLDFSVSLLLNIEEDDDDFWYVLFDWKTNETHLHSGVGRIIFLKDEMNEDAYDYLLNIWNLNSRILAR